MEKYRNAFTLEKDSSPKINGRGIRLRKRRRKIEKSAVEIREKKKKGKA